MTEQSPITHHFHKWLDDHVDCWQVLADSTMEVVQGIYYSLHPDQKGKEEMEDFLERNTSLLPEGYFRTWLNCNHADWRKEEPIIIASFYREFCKLSTLVCPYCHGPMTEGENDNLGGCSDCWAGKNQEKENLS